MTSRSLLGILALVVLGLLLWELRWVMLALFGAVVLAVALDVPITMLRRRLPLNRPLALALGGVLVAAGLLALVLPDASSSEPPPATGKASSTRRPGTGA